MFITVGSLLSPTGVDNLTGAAGTTVMAGQAVQSVGVVVAMVCGVFATRAEYVRARRTG